MRGPAIRFICWNVGAGIAIWLAIYPQTMGQERPIPTPTKTVKPQKETVSVTIYNNDSKHMLILRISGQGKGNEKAVDGKIRPKQKIIVQLKRGPYLLIHSADGTAPGVGLADVKDPTIWLFSRQLVTISGATGMMWSYRIGATLPKVFLGLWRCVNGQADDETLSPSGGTQGRGPHSDWDRKVRQVKLLREVKLKDDGTVDRENSNGKVGRIGNWSADAVEDKPGYYGLVICENDILVRISEDGKKMHCVQNQEEALVLEKIDLPTATPASQPVPKSSPRPSTQPSQASDPVAQALNLAQNYMAAGMKDKAKQVLEKAMLESSDSPKMSEAHALLEELRK